MNLYKLSAFVVLSMLIAILFASVANQFTRVADTALANELTIQQSNEATANAPTIATRNYLPIILLNSPSAISCITLGNGLKDVGTHCSDVTIELDFLAVGGTNGTTNNPARSDHTHLGQIWSGSPSTGLWIQTSALSGTAIFGYATNNTTKNIGVYGATFSDIGYGVVGVQGSGSGITPGAPAAVWGDSNLNYGVLGASNNFVGVIGLSNNYDGVRGFSTNGIGIRGSTNASTAPGIYGTAPVTGVVGIASNTSGANNGVYGYSENWNGVYGSSNSGTGVAAGSNSGTGLYATSASGFAINVAGDATQTRSRGGMVKAMADIKYDSGLNSVSVLKCFNSQTSGSSVSTAPCNITITRNGTGSYDIDFGFTINDRFIIVSPYNSGALIADPTIFPTASKVRVAFLTGASVFTDPYTFFIYVY